MKVTREQFYEPPMPCALSYTMLGAFSLARNFEEPHVAHIPPGLEGKVIFTIIAQAPHIMLDDLLCM